MIVLITGPPGTGKSTLAAMAVQELDATVLGWDWVMASLTWCEPVMDACRELDFATSRRIGWSMVENLARAQCRHGQSVVLDGVARDLEVASIRALGVETGSVVKVVATECSDREELRNRITGRRRDIPGWHELQWEEVESTLSRWVTPTDCDLRLDTAVPEAATDTFLPALRSW